MAQDVHLRRLPEWRNGSDVLQGTFREKNNYELLKVKCLLELWFFESYVSKSARHR